jgi:hypothetical protein
MMNSLFNKFLTIALIVLFSGLFLFVCASSHQEFERGKFNKNIGNILTQENVINRSVKYLYVGQQYNVQLRPNSFSYEFFQISKNDSILSRYGHPRDPGIISYDFHRIDVNFEGANSNLELITLDELDGSCESVRYLNVYEGVDIDFFTTPTGVKYNIIIHPDKHGNISKKRIEQIKLRYQGQLNLSINNETEPYISLQTSLGEFRETIPVSFFTDEYTRDFTGKETKVALIDNGGGLISFKVKEKMKANHRKLVIDPLPQLLWATYFGGTGREQLESVMVDDAGNIFTSGFTQSPEGIATSGVYQGSLLGFFNAFLAKYDKDGNRIWSTYYGGETADRCYGMAMDDEGNIFISGSTYSETNIATPGVYQEYVAGQDDSFIAKFNPEGQLVWGTYFGGPLHDFLADITIDSHGDIIATGHTTSEENIASPGAYMEFLPGGENGVLAKFSTDGQLVWSTYFGNHSESGWGIDTDQYDYIYVSGGTRSTTNIATSGVHQETHGGDLDAFLMKFSTEGFPVWGTYLGGEQYDNSHDLIVTKEGYSYIIGQTESNQHIATSGAYQEQMGSIDDAFIAKFNPQGQIEWSTYVGGNMVDILLAITFDQDSMIYVGGYTQSGNNIAVPNAFQPSPAGLFDVMLMKYDQNGQYLWGTYFGGPESEQANGIALDKLTNHIVVAGIVRSEQGIATLDADQEVYGGGITDGFVSRFCVPPFPVLSTGDDLSVCVGESINFTVEDFHESYSWNVGGDLPHLTFTSYEPGEHPIYVDVVDTTGCPGYSDTLIVTVLPEYPDIIVVSSSACAGEIIQISTAAEYVDYLWSTGETSPMIEVQQEEAGELWLSVTITDENGCQFTSDETAIQIYPLPTPTFTLNGSANFCEGGVVEITTSGFYQSYLWFDGSENSWVLIDEESEIWVTVKDLNGCVGHSDTLLVSSQTFTVTVSSSAETPICQGDSFNLLVNGTYDSYVWSNGSEYPTLAIATDTLSLGEHAYFVTVFNACGDSAVSPPFYFEVHESPEPIIFSESDFGICPNDETELYTQTFSEYLWSDSSLSQSIMVNEAGEYWVEVVNSSGCRGVSDTVNVTPFEVDHPEIIISPEGTLCIGEEFVLSIDNSYESYSWSNGAESSTIAETMYEIGQHTYSVSVEDANGCLLSDSVDLEIELCLGTDELPANPNLTVYPNPVTDKLWIATNEHEIIHRIMIYDLHGKLLLNREFQPQQSIQLSLPEMSEGIYLMKVHTNSGNWNYKLVVLKD